MNRRVGDAKGCLRSHACFKCILDRRNDVANVVQAAENTGDVNALSMLYLVHQLAYIGWNGEHTQCVQTTVEHVCLDAYFVERLCKGTNGFVRIFAIKEVNLLKGTTIRFNAGEASHLYNNRCYAFQLVLTWLKLATALEHVAIDKTELYLTLCHCI